MATTPKKKNPPPAKAKGKADLLEQLAKQSPKGRHGKPAPEDEDPPPEPMPPPAPEAPAKAPEPAPVATPAPVEAPPTPQPAPPPPKPEEPAAPAAPKKAPAKPKPEGPGVKTHTVNGTAIIVLGFDPDYPDELWCMIEKDGGSWKNHYHKSAIVITEEVYIFLYKEAPPAEAVTLPKGVDRFGQTFEEAVEEQKQQLGSLEVMMNDDEYFRVRKWCKKTNAPVDETVTPRGAHHVPRGMELMLAILKRGKLILKMNEDD